MNNSEKCLLGILLNNPEKYEEIGKHGNVFESKDTKKLYDIIINRQSKTGGFDKNLLLDFIGENDNFDIGTFYEIYESEYDIDKWDNYLNEVLTKKIKKDLRNDILWILGNNHINYIDIRNNLNDLIDKMHVENKETGNDNQALCRETLEEVGNEGNVKKISSGISFIDNWQLGYSQGELVIIGARPSEGKTSYAISLFGKQIMKDIIPAYFSIEMSKKDINKILTCNIAGVDTIKYDTKAMTNVEKDKVINALERMYEKKYFIFQGYKYIDSILKRCKQLKRDHGVRLVYIDYIQLCKARGKQGRTEEVEYISNEIKRFCNEEEMTIVALAQLNREFDKTKDKPPQLGHLKNSGAIEQDADIAVLLHTIDKCFNNDANQRVIDFYVHKNRQGRQGKYRQIFYPQIRRFENMTNY